MPSPRQENVERFVGDLSWSLDDSWSLDPDPATWTAVHLVGIDAPPRVVARFPTLPLTSLDELLGSRGEAARQAMLRVLRDAWEMDQLAVTAADALARHAWIDDALATRFTRTPELNLLRQRAVRLVAQACLVDVGEAGARAALERWHESPDDLTRESALDLLQVPCAGAPMPEAARALRDILCGTALEARPDGSPTRDAVTTLAPSLLASLWHADLLDVDAVEAAVRLDPSVPRRGLPAARSPELGPHDKTSFRETLRARLDEACERWVDRLDERDIAPLRASWPRGASVIARACEQVERLGLSRLSDDDDPAGAIGHVLRRATCSETDDLGPALARISGLATSTLELVQREGGDHAMILATRALARPDEEALLVLATRQDGAPDPESWWHPQPAWTSLDRQAIRDAVGAVGEARARELLAMLKTRGPKERTMPIEAVMGWNRSEVLRGFKHRSHHAIRAFAVLPVTGGDDEAFERHQALQGLLATNGNLGARRRENERLLVDDALALLAQSAGHDDAEAFTWRMEARIEEHCPLASSQCVGEWTLEIATIDGEHRLVASKAGRPLKSIPSALRKSAEHAEMTSALDALGRQRRRLIASLERLACADRAVPASAFRRLASLRSGRDLLSAVVVRRGGAFMLGSDTGEADSRDVLVAHPQHLHDAGCLDEWQRRITSLGVRQPFRQVFRELYLFEREEATAHRFADCVVETRVASALLRERGWFARGWSGYLVQKPHGPSGLQGEIEFPGLPHFHDGQTHSRMGRLRFTKPGASPRDRCIVVPLAEVPPVLLSEALRDMDFVATVAGGGRLSGEILRRRSEQVLALLSALGVGEASRRGRAVQVRRSDAEWSLDLGTAEVRRLPGETPVAIDPSWAIEDPRVPLVFDDDGLLRKITCRALWLAEGRTP